MDTKAKAEVYLDVEKLDEAAAMFAFLTSSGILSTNHAFTNKCILSAPVLWVLWLRNLRPTFIQP